MSPEEQIEWTIASLRDTLLLKGWPNSRRDDLKALVEQLDRQWHAYKAGTLPLTDPTVEI